MNFPINSASKTLFGLGLNLPNSKAQSKIPTPSGYSIKTPVNEYFDIQTSASPIDLNTPDGNNPSGATKTQTQSLSISLVMINYTATRRLIVGTAAEPAQLGDVPGTTFSPVGGANRGTLPRLHRWPEPMPRTVRAQLPRRALICPHLYQFSLVRQARLSSQPHFSR